MQSPYFSTGLAFHSAEGYKTVLVGERKPQAIISKNISVVKIKILRDKEIKSKQNLLKAVISCVAAMLKHGCSPFSSALVGVS